MLKPKSSFSRAVVEAIEARTLLTATFAEPQAFDTGSNPAAVAIADVNGDGVSDVVTVSDDPSAGTVLIGDGAGALVARADYPLSSDAQRIALADLNGDSRPEIIAGTNEAITVLANLGDGTFAAGVDYAMNDGGLGIGTMVVADMNADGTADVVATDFLNRTFSIFPNDGAGNLGSPATVSVNFNANDVAVTDVDANGTADLLVANNPLGDPPLGRLYVLLRDATGAVLRTESYDAGLEAAKVVTADLNEDGRPDAIVGGSGTVSVLLGNVDGTFSPRTSYSHGGQNTGTRSMAVADMNGDANLDVVVLNQDFFPLQILHGNGTGGLAAAVNYAAASTGGSPLAVGVGELNGDDKPDLVVTQGSNRVAVLPNTTTIDPPTEPPVEPPVDPPPTEGPTDAPDLTVSIARLALPPTFTTGDRGTVVVSVSNSGVQNATGPVTVELFASTDATVDAADIPLDTGVALRDKPVNLATGRAKTLRGAFTISEALPAGPVYILARVSTAAFNERSTDNNATVGATQFQSTRAFGQVGERRGVRLVRADEDGSQIIFTLSGPGTGTFPGDGDGVTLDGTSPATKLSVAVRGGDGIATLSDVTINGPVGTVAMPKVNLTGDLTVAGDVRSVSALNVIGGAINLAGTAPVALKLGAVTNATLNATPGVRSIVAASWTGIITAPYVTTIKTTGDFSAALTLSAGTAAPGGHAIRSASVGGNVGPGGWNISGNVGAIVVRGSVDAGLAANITGLLGSLRVLGDFNGTVATANIGAVAINGNATGARLLAGVNLGDVSVPGDETFTAGTIRSINVRGAVTGSRFLAGVADADGVLTVLPGGSIRSIAVRGGADASSRFRAESLPRVVRLGTETVITADDERFRI